jgi:molybdopterin/thiamine biosynthesis adenylyltransferase
VRDEQVRRYARHILLPDVGGLGQTALMVAAAHLELPESEPTAELVAAAYLVAGGVGTLGVTGATEAQLAWIATHGPDTKVVSSTLGRPVVLTPKPPWWPGAADDDHALALWRGSLAAIRWMSDIANR